MSLSFSWRSRLRRVAGMTAVGSTALAVLTLGLVFAATAAPRVVFAAKTSALRQTLATTPPLQQTVGVTTTWTDASGALGPGGGDSGPVLSAGQLTELATQLRAGYNRGPVVLGPASASWTGLTTSQLETVLSGAVAANKARVLLEIAYRQPLAKYLRVVAGRLPATGTTGPSRPAGPVTVTPVFGSPFVFYPRLQIAVTARTAARFGLHPGSTVVIKGPQASLGPPRPPVTLEVTGIVEPRDPAANFWTADEALVQPDLECPLCPGPGPFWAAGAFTGPAELTALQRDFGQQGLGIQWQFPLRTAGTTWEQAAPLLTALSRLGAQVPKLAGAVAPVASTLSASSPLLGPLRGAIATAQATDTLLWILYVSLGGSGLAVLVLAARMVVLRRSAELTLRRARGASPRHIAAAAAGGAAVACVPAALLGVALGVSLTSGPEPPGAWWAPAAVLSGAVAAPGLLAAWQQRLPGHRAAATGRRRDARSRVRLVVEVTAVAASVAGLIVFRQQGAVTAGGGAAFAGGAPGTVFSGGQLPGGGPGANLYTSAAPVLIAIPAVIVILRLYPLVLRGLLRISARGPGATAFLGLSRAVRTRLTPALPAFALVLALSVAAFAGLIRDAVINAEVAASWRAAGADVSITAVRQFNVNPVAALTPQAQRAAATLPGVTHAAAVWQSQWQTAFGQSVTVLAVDPAGYAALVAATQGYPRVQAGLLAVPPRRGEPQPVLASPQAASQLSGAAGLDTLTSGAGVAPVRVRVAGLLSSTPALPGGGAFVIMPLRAVHSTLAPAGRPPVNQMLLTGTGIDHARLDAVMRDMVQGGEAIVRSDILSALATAPLQHGAFLLFGLALWAAAVLGLLVMLLELALGAADREAALARLATMGLAEGQRARMVALEVLPAVLAAALAGLSCALALPPVVAPAIDLSVFTGSAAAVTLAPNAASVALPLAALAVLAALSLAVEIRTGRRRGVAASLRMGE